MAAVPDQPKDHQKPRKTAAEILATEDTKTKDVYVEEWDTFVTVRGLTKRQQLDIRTASMVNGEPDAEKSQQGLWLEGVTAPKFEEHQLPLLFEKNAGAVDTVLKEVLILSGMGEGMLTEKKKEFRPRPE
jgi:hypothetical protein